MNFKILIIEDDSACRELIRYLLSSFGHQTLTANCAEAGLKLALAERPDLIISDDGMPGMNGCELAKIIKGEAQIRNIPLVAVTAHARSADCQRMLAAGFDHFLTKPIDPNTFVRQIESILQGGESPAGARDADPEMAETGVKQVTLDKLSRLFIQHLPTTLEALRNAFGQTDWNALRLAAHQALGTCVFLGAPALIRALRNLENIVDTDNAQTAGNLLAEVELQAAEVAKSIAQAHQTGESAAAA
jgi:CheY-like chemotaxis protein